MVWNKGLHGFMSGKKNNFWKGGITPKDQILRSRLKFKLWRAEVFKLNPKVCVICGSNKYLVAHHPKSFKDYPLLRYNSKNGIVVCRSCHPAIHRWGLEYMKRIGKANFKRKCLTCKKIFSFTLYRKETACFCSKSCWYNRPTRKTKEQKLQYKRNWYLKNKLCHSKQ